MNCWSQPLSAAAALSSFAMTRSCSFAIRSLILRPEYTGELGIQRSNRIKDTHDDFAEKGDFEAVAFPKDPVSG